MAGLTNDDTARGPLPKNIMVGVRVRPLSKLERSEAWEISEERNSLSRRGAEHVFHRVWDQHRRNICVFQDLCSEIVAKFIDGFSATIFAYGQTGSGKTHTLLGDGDDPGVIALTAGRLFELAGSCGEKSFLVRASYTEIYNERITDLLSAGRAELELYEHPAHGPTLRNPTTVCATSIGDVLRVLEDGERHRSYGATAMNRRSSRSHTIFQLSIEAAADNPSTLRISTLNLVDLAGSERVSKSRAKGQRQKEGAMINQSLLNLGLVIRELAKRSSDSRKQQTFIPFRRSKLTRLLTRALGGNSCTALICCVSPALRNVDETASTLHFAHHASKVVNRVARNVVDQKDAQIFAYQREIESLRRQLSQFVDSDSGVDYTLGGATKPLRRKSIERLKRGAEAAASAVAGTPLLEERLRELESSFIDGRRRSASDAKHEHIRAKWRCALYKLGKKCSRRDPQKTATDLMLLRRVSTLRRKREAMESLLDVATIATTDAVRADQTNLAVGSLSAKLEAFQGVVETQQQSLEEMQSKLRASEARVAQLETLLSRTTAQRDACAHACIEWEHVLAEAVEDHTARGLSEKEGPAFVLLKNLLQEMQLRRIQRSEDIRSLILC